MRLSFTPEGWLVGTDVTRFPTVRIVQLEVKHPLGLVWHTTGGRGGPGHAEALARRIQHYRRGVDRPASWHILITTDGRIFQSAPIRVGTWHVGRPGTVGGHSFANVNRGTIGVELESPGQLVEVDGRYFCWPYWRSDVKASRLPDPRFEMRGANIVRMADGSLFTDFPAIQEATAIALVEALARELGWSRAALTYTHHQFDPHRKVDPGPLWAQIVLPRVLDFAFGADPTDVSAAAPATTKEVARGQVG